MDIIVNGERQVVKTATNVQQLLDIIGVEAIRVVVELNRDILPRNGFTETSLKDGDLLEVIQFVGGG
jgi:thiamine biosynthesis protein ThiS